MTIEAAIQENTVAVKALIAALEAHAKMGPRYFVRAEPVGAIGGPATTPAPQPAAKPTAKAAAAPEAKPAAAGVTAPAEAIDYEKHVKPLIMRIVNERGGKEAAVKFLAPFGASNALKLKPEQYAEVIEAANKFLATEEAVA